MSNQLLRRRQTGCAHPSGGDGVGVPHRASTLKQKRDAFTEKGFFLTNDQQSSLQSTSSGIDCRYAAVARTAVTVESASILAARARHAP